MHQLIEFTGSVTVRYWHMWDEHVKVADHVGLLERSQTVIEIHTFWFYAYVGIIL